MKSKITLTLILLVISPVLIAQTIKWDQVRLRNQIDEKQCKFIKQEICSTKRKNGVARCQKWHQKRAAKSGADSYIIINAASEQNPFVVNNQLFTASNTSMTADYYLCSQPQVKDSDNNEQGI